MTPSVAKVNGSGEAGQTDCLEGVLGRFLPPNLVSLGSIMSTIIRGGVIRLRELSLLDRPLSGLQSSLMDTSNASQATGRVEAAWVYLSLSCIEG